MTGLKFLREFTESRRLVRAENDCEYILTPELPRERRKSSRFGRVLP